MAVARLPLSLAAEVAASGDQSQGHKHCENGRETREEAGPMDVDEAETIVRLVQGDLMRFVVDLTGDTEIGGIVEHNWRGGF